MNAHRSLLAVAVTALALSVAAIPAASDSLSYTDQHVIVKGEEKARNDRRPQKADKPLVQLGNVRIEVPALVSASPLSIVNLESRSASARARPKERSALFILNPARALSVTEEQRFRSLVADGQAEVWAPDDVHAYVGTLMKPFTSSGDSALHSWLPCDEGCENWLWIERRGVEQ